MRDTALPLDKRHLRAAFERAAGTYDDVAVLQRTVADRLLERLDVVKLVPATVLDLGCGTGYVSRALACRYPRARHVALDFAEAMTRRTRRAMRWRRLFGSGGGQVCADAEVLPFADRSLDMVFSNLALQWCDPQKVFGECLRVLRPGGLFLFTTFGPETLAELRAAWRAADEGMHVHGFVDMRDLGDLLVRTGFAEPVMDVDRLVLTYDDVLGVLRDLKHLGAHNVARSRARGLTGKQRFTHFRATYEAMRRDGRIPATYEVVYGLAWAPESSSRRLADGSVAVPLAGLRRAP